ncbi:cupin domain-containing protein [Pseudomonas sp. gcc21]|uniref:cupin domain-containing protein n=1 Tax=Pseudomonas sp. gcc21 TaxID=2726989 RepID=UPI001451B13A|nr:cupin domain-containing protein [Pseudomonas sp. gcc21]QJD59215.1 cupin domain-containing protein [Pseudomonas sp. gcc21]
MKPSPQRTDSNTGRLLARTVLYSALLVASSWSVAGNEQAFTRDYASGDIEWSPCPAFMPDSCALAVLQGDPEKENTDVLFRLRSGTTAPHHWHTSAERMVLLSGRMMVEYDHQQPVVMESGTYAYGPPEHAHTATCQSEENCVLFISFDKPVDAFAVDE